MKTFNMKKRETNLLLSYIIHHVMNLVNIHISMGFLQRLGSLVHGLKDCCVRVGPFEGLALLLDGRQCSINLLQLTVVSLFSFESLQIKSNALKRRAEMETLAYF